MRVLIQGLPNRPHANAGQVCDLPDAEAEDMIRRGSAVRAAEEPPAAPTALAELDDADEVPDEKVPGSVRHVQPKAKTGRGKRR